jgi:hypothetical protein
MPQLFPVSVPHIAEMSGWWFFSFVPDHFFRPAELSNGWTDFYDVKSK